VLVWLQPTGRLNMKTFWRFWGFCMVSALITIVAVLAFTA